jgi:hypothetical protein
MNYLLAVGVWERALIGAAVAIVILWLGRQAQAVWERSRKPDSPQALANANLPYGWIVVALILAGVVAMFIYLLSVDPGVQRR